MQLGSGRRYTQRVACHWSHRFHFVVIVYKSNLLSRLLRIWPLNNALWASREYGGIITTRGRVAHLPRRCGHCGTRAGKRQLYLPGTAHILEFIRKCINAGPATISHRVLVQLGKGIYGSRSAAEAFTGFVKPTKLTKHKKYILARDMFLMLFSSLAREE